MLTPSHPRLRASCPELLQERDTWFLSPKRYKFSPKGNSEEFLGENNPLTEGTFEKQNQHPTGLLWPPHEPETEPRGESGDTAGPPAHLSEA